MQNHSAPTVPGISNELPRCLNVSVCNEHHFVKNCPKTSTDEEKHLLKVFHEKHCSTRSIRALCFSRYSPSPVAARNVRYPATLSDSVPIVINGEYGADHSALSKDHLERCAVEVIFVQVLPLKDPIPMKLASDDGTEAKPRAFYAKVRARVSTTIQLASGPLRLRNLEYLVFDEHMSEVILARPVLQTIDFDIDKHLSTVRSQFHDMEFSQVGFSPGGYASTTDEPPTTPGHLSRLLLPSSPNPPDTVRSDYLPDSVFYGDHSVQDDLADDEEEVCTGVHKATDVQPVLEDMLSSAKTAGLPGSLHVSLRELVLQYRDIFRNKMGSDPPANVPPMVIRLKPGAKPVRFKLRRYSPPQAAFLRNMVDELLQLGLIYRNIQSQWASAHLIVPKTGPEFFVLLWTYAPLMLRPNLQFGQCPT